MSNPAGAAAVQELLWNISQHFLSICVFDFAETNLNKLKCSEVFWVELKGQSFGCWWNSYDLQNDIKIKWYPVQGIYSSYVVSAQWWCIFGTAFSKQATTVSIPVKWKENLKWILQFPEAWARPLSHSCLLLLYLRFLKFCFDNFQIRKMNAYKQPE